MQHIRIQPLQTTELSPQSHRPPVYGQIVLSDITVEDFLKQHLNTPRGLAIYADSFSVSNPFVGILFPIKSH